MDGNELSFDRAIVEEDGSLTMQSREFFKALIDKINELEARIVVLEP